MVDLQAWNEKLVDRGERIVMEVAGVTREAARAAIEAAEGRVRTAIVMLRRECSAEAADALLVKHDFHLRAILGDPPPVASA
jgi:N-acetylmuramic acid 6-phosphate etherase